MNNPFSKVPLIRNWWKKSLYLFCRRPSNRTDLIQFLQKIANDGIFAIDSLPMIEGVFRVGEMCVREIMVPRSNMKLIFKNASLEEAHKIVVESAHSRFPVIDLSQDNIEGILLAKDLVRYLDSEQYGVFQLKDLLRQAVIVPESKRIKVLLDEFRKNRNHMAIVVDEYGRVSGLVTIEDVLEQIVGDITDEHDIAEEQYVYENKDGSYRVKALMPLDEFNKYFSCDLNHEGSDTVGGFLISLFGYLPKQGESKSLKNMLFKIDQADTRRIHFLLVKKN